MTDIFQRGLRKLAFIVNEARAIRKAKASIARFPTDPAAPRHALPGRLTISLTSYPKRFPTLSFTLKSLLDQSVKPDRVVLWIAKGDEKQLPKAVLDLQASGLEIKVTPKDIRSYKKIIPLLNDSPSDYIVTADDDIFYERHWLQSLLDGFDPVRPRVVCRRAHRPSRLPDGSLTPYASWKFEHIFDGADEDIFATGVGGVLYFPGCFHPLVTDEALFTELCPLADDVWLYWMVRMNGNRYRQVGGRFQQVVWPGSQATSLRSQNLEGGKNDEQIKAMEQRFGTV